ncbi:hypothetical protein D7Y41_02725 [Anaerotruncus sp. 1XD22-93]|nr:hypothetical protein [Lachnospiraceae bacterium]NBI74223.1 hypothetical protein [Lachnospiraceae bacterium]RKK00388.1 hypothetical protein D7Y41_02725 [Anaerotruncus sp. 1XD22-93]
MIKLMIVAGRQSAKLAEHLNKTGAFRADYVYHSLAQNQEKIKNSIIKVDKLLYIYQPEEDNGVTSIREDMVILQKLIISDEFFSTNEVIFIQKSSSLSEQAADYFNTVMKECTAALRQERHKKAQILYSIETVDGVLSFQSIHNYLLGVTEAEDFHNTIGKVYRYEKGSEATTAYVAADTRNSIVEPFTFENIDDYERARDNSIKFDPGRVVHDSKEDELETIDSPVFGKLHISRVSPVKNTLLLTGGDKTGKSMWGAALAVSSMSAKVRTFVLDLTVSGNIRNTFKSFDTEFSEIDMLSMLHPNSETESFITLCRPTAIEMEVVCEFLQLLYREEVSSKFDQVLILADRASLPGIKRHIQPNLKMVFYCMFPLECDLPKIKQSILECGGALCTILCSNALQIGVKDKYLHPSELKPQAPHDVKVVAPIQFTNMNLDSTLYEKLMGGDC